MRHTAKSRRPFGLTNPSRTEPSVAGPGLFACCFWSPFCVPHHPAWSASQAAWKPAEPARSKRDVCASLFLLQAKTCGATGHPADERGLSTTAALPGAFNPSAGTLRNSFITCLSRHFSNLKFLYTVGHDAKKVKDLFILVGNRLFHAAIGVSRLVFFLILLEI